jgi:hypothetical protein
VVAQLSLVAVPLLQINLHRPDQMAVILIQNTEARDENMYQK